MKCCHCLEGMPELQTHIVEETVRYHQCFRERLFLFIPSYYPQLTRSADLILNSLILPELNDRYLLIPSIQSLNHSPNDVNLVVMQTKRTITETPQDSIGRVYPLPR